MNLEEIKQRESKATKGEWKIYNEDFGKAIGTVEHHPQLQAPTPIVTLGLGKGGHKIHINESNALFIAHARQDIPNLIAEVERLREALTFYANQDYYEPFEQLDENRSDAFNFIDLDRGETAQKALEK